MGRVRHNVPLAPLTTYRFGGAAEFYAEPVNEAELVELLAAWRATPVPLLVLGRGSNLVISDRGVPGLVIRPGGEFLDITVGGDGAVLTGAAAPLPKVARTAAKAGRGGLEFFVGVPGSIGGAVRMNAGCHGSETSDWLVAARVVDAGSGEIANRDPAAMDMAYRHSSLKDHHFVISASFRTVARRREDSERIMREITQWRKTNQPGGTHNAGSVFKNPPGDAAGRLIDAAGLKGFRVGGAAVSERHANFFEADRDATAQDVYDLVWQVRDRVAKFSGTRLEPEVRFVGEFDAVESAR